MADPFQFIERFKKQSGETFPPDFILADGELYLRYQTTWSSSLVVHVDFPEWDEEKLDLLISDHPELIDYLPDKDDPYKGISWIKDKR